MQTEVLDANGTFDTHAQPPGLSDKRGRRKRLHEGSQLAQARCRRLSQHVQHSAGVGRDETSVPPARCCYLTSWTTMARHIIWRWKGFQHLRSGPRQHGEIQSQQQRNLSRTCRSPARRRVGKSGVFQQHCALQRCRRAAHVSPHQQRHVGDVAKLAAFHLVPVSGDVSRGFGQRNQQRNRLGCRETAIQRCRMPTTPPIWRMSCTTAIRLDRVTSLVQETSSSRPS